MPVKINGTTSGSVTLAAPDTGSDVTLTLPDAAGTVATQGWVQSLAFGKVLQVVQGTTTTEVNVSTTTLTDTNLSVTIAPTLASSKVLLIISQTVRVAQSSTSSCSGRYAVLRDSTKIAEWVNRAFGISGGGSSLVLDNIQPMVILDSPATTSSVTYKTQGARDNAGTISYQSNSAPSFIIAVEIGV